MSKKVLAVIPARGGSKSIPFKNRKSFAGFPLIAWTIALAKLSSEFFAVVVSSDDKCILNIANLLGVDVIIDRPKNLCTDTMSTAPVIKHALNYSEDYFRVDFDYVYTLEPTSPSRTHSHIIESYKILQEVNCDSISGITKLPHHFSPGKIISLSTDTLSITGANKMNIRDMVHRRQDIESKYYFNGLIWGTCAELLRSSKPSIWGESNVGYEIEKLYSIDLDEPFEWDINEYNFKKLLQKEAGLIKSNNFLEKKLNHEKYKNIQSCNWG